MDCNRPGSSVHGILQARILEWVAMPSLLQGIFPVQGWNLHLLCLLHWQAGSLPLTPPGKPHLMVLMRPKWDTSEKEMATHSSTLAWKSPWTEEPGRLQSWGRCESDVTERLHFHCSLPCIGEGNGNPLQCSCLENPRDGGAWWAAVYGVAQSRTQLKRLSSSSSKWDTWPMVNAEEWVGRFYFIKPIKHETHDICKS